MPPPIVTGGAPVTLFPPSLTGVFHPSPAVSVGVSRCRPLQLSPSILPSTHSTPREMWIFLGDRKRLPAPRLTHIFLSAMEELRGKARIARIAHFISCGFIILLLTHSEFHEACGFPTALVCGEDTFQ